VSHNLLILVVAMSFLEVNRCDLMFLIVIIVIAVCLHYVIWRLLAHQLRREWGSVAVVR
jgi:hypothetical protein